MQCDQRAARRHRARTRLHHSLRIRPGKRLVVLVLKEVLVLEVVPLLLLLLLLAVEKVVLGERLLVVDIKVELVLVRVRVRVSVTVRVRVRARLKVSVSVGGRVRVRVNVSPLRRSRPFSRQRACRSEP